MYSDFFFRSTCISHWINVYLISLASTRGNKVKNESLFDFDKNLIYFQATQGEYNNPEQEELVS